MTPAAILASARRITVKVGSSLLVDDQGVREQWLASLANDLADLNRDGRQLVIVSSGAVAIGRKQFALPRSRRLDVKQAAAALGQPLLMRAWEAALSREGMVAAQLLLTLGDTESRRRWRNARATLEVLLKNGVVPIVNENDSVATEEIRYGDNDRLSARVAQMVGADLLILLSDVDGLYEADPRRHPAADHISQVEVIDEKLMAKAGPAFALGTGTGGMRTKLEAARIAQESGCSTLIGSGVENGPLASLAVARTRATVVLPRGSPSSSYKAWIAGSLAPEGRVLVDMGALAALRSGGSLLPSGVLAIEGDFSHGASVVVVGPDEADVALGLTRYGSSEARAIVGRRARDIAAALGYSRGDELIHRDDLVLK